MALSYIRLYIDCRFTTPLNARQRLEILTYAILRDYVVISAKSKTNYLKIYNEVRPRGEFKKQCEIVMAKLNAYHDCNIVNN